MFLLVVEYEHVNVTQLNKQTNYEIYASHGDSLHLYGTAPQALTKLKLQMNYKTWPLNLTRSSRVIVGKFIQPSIGGGGGGGGGKHDV